MGRPDPNSPGLASAVAVSVLRHTAESPGASGITPGARILDASRSCAVPRIPEARDEQAVPLAPAGRQSSSRRGRNQPAGRAITAHTQRGGLVYVGSR
jgi:hypothetical protein